MTTVGEMTEVEQEYVDNQPTDVEVESRDDDHRTVKPWNPDDIRIRPKTYSLRQLVDMINDKDIDLAPDFQRQYVWKSAQQNGLIESLLLGIPLPSFYFNESQDGRVQVVDGVQRLTTISRYYRGEFALRNLTYLKALEEKKYTDLDGAFRRRLQNTQFVAHVIDPATPYRVRFDVFKRINTGGTPLSAQEIRHCMSSQRSRDFLVRLVQMPAFGQTLGGVVGHKRMADREIALRLIAFHVIPVESYRNYDSLDGFLGAVTEKLDGDLSDAALNRLQELAERALSNARAVFGGYAFRKRWPGNDRLNPINRTLVESWGTALSKVGPIPAGSKSATTIAEEAVALMADSEFENSITGGTGDPAKVETRMTMTDAIVARVVQ